MTFKALNVAIFLKNIVKMNDGESVKTYALSNHNDGGTHHGSKFYDLDLDSDKISNED